jgi:hypothetical protein
LRLLSVWTLFLLPAQAATIYNNGTPNGIGATNFSNFRVVEDFSLASSATVSGLRFWTQTTNSAQTMADLSWAIYADNAGLPGAVVQSGTATNVAAIADVNNSHRREISVNFALSAGDYFIEFHPASGLTVDAPVSFYWAFTADNTTDRYRQGDLSGVPTIEVNPNVGSGALHAAFQLDGTFDSAGVPEPGSLALVAIGLAVLWRGGRNRNRRAY